VSRILRQHASPAPRALISRQALIKAAAGTTAAFLALVVAACGSSSSSSNAALLGSTVQQECTQVADVLSDGPDPDADPVGHAEAQVLPLRKLSISDAKLHSAVLTLASAYQTFSTSSSAGTSAASRAVTKAEGAVNSICPGAAS